MTEENATPEKILELVEKHNPKTVEELIQLIENDLDIARKTAMEHVIHLEDQGRLKLSFPEKAISENIFEYLRSRNANWFWITMVLALATTISVFTISENSYPLIYIRYILGSIFILILPGYSLIKTLFPTREIDDIERTALSIGTSLAIVPLVGLLLNYTSWGIRLTPITLSILLLTAILAIIGIIREHQEKINI
jgi:uncharacterized membrane protein